jgi:hypothetical protein
MAELHKTPAGELRSLTPSESAEFDAAAAFRTAALERVGEHDAILRAFGRNPGSAEVALEHLGGTAGRAAWADPLAARPVGPEVSMVDLLARSGRTVNDEEWRLGMLGALASGQRHHVARFARYSDGTVLPNGTRVNADEMRDLLISSSAGTATLTPELFEDSDPVAIGQVLRESFGGALATELDRVALKGSGTAPERRGIRNQTGVSMNTTAAAASWAVVAERVGVLVGANVPVERIGVAVNPTSWTTIMPQAEAGGQPIARPPFLADVQVLRPGTSRCPPPASCTPATTPSWSSACASVWTSRCSASGTWTRARSGSSRGSALTSASCTASRSPSAPR